MTETKALIIGAGQAGLAAAYWLRRLGVSATVVDASQRIGDSWRHRYRSLTLFTPRRLSALPGSPLRGDPEGYASGGEFADYLESYAEKFGLLVRSNERARELTKQGNIFRARLQSGQEISSSFVVIATGGFQQPLVPQLATGLSPDVQQLTAESYNSPRDVVDGPVVVVGDGATGRDIAADLAASHDVILARGRSRRLLPTHILGVSTWTWLKMLGLLSADVNSPIGRHMRRADPFPNRQRGFSDLREMGIQIRDRVVAAEARTATFADGTTATNIASVVWSMGYRDDTSWLSIPSAVDGRGAVVHRYGKSPVDGLFYVGRPWQRNRASALIMGVGADARLIATEVASRLGHDVRPKLVKNLNLS